MACLAGIVRCLGRTAIICCLRCVRGIRLRIANVFPLVFKIGLIPAGTLQPEGDGGYKFTQRFFPALGAEFQWLITDLLNDLQLVVTPVA